MSHAAWCRGLFDALSDRGTWIVPRSGLVLQKREAERELLLVGECDPAEAEVDQGQDFDAIREQFARVGIAVTRATKGEK